MLLEGCFRGELGCYRKLHSMAAWNDVLCPQDNISALCDVHLLEI